MRQYALILFLFAAVFSSSAEETNYFCVVCGKGPLTGNIWMARWGAVCDDCYKSENHCAICGLPIREGGDAVKTGDGRFICKFDKPNAVLDVSEAREVFADTRREMIGLFGSSFALNYPEVTVNLFDVDYWSEAGRGDGLHKFGFASTRTSIKGNCTHEVVMLSGRLREELAATAAHEYTHLWINENRPGSHVVESDTIEAICELAGYKLMQAHAKPEQVQKILDNPYTHGEIKNVVAFEKENGIGTILNWVKNGTTTTLSTQSAARVVPIKTPTLAFTNLASNFPTTVKLGGLLWNDKNPHAIVSGVSFARGDVKPVPLRERTLLVRCWDISRIEATLEVDGYAGKFTLKIGEEKNFP